MKAFTDHNKGHAENISLEEGISKILQGTSPLTEAVQVDLLDGVGRITDRDIYSQIHQPPFPRSPLDGYAVKADDTVGASQEDPIHLKVVDKIFAGDAKTPSLSSGQAIRIMTGAPIPKGCNAIIRQEDTDCGEQVVKIKRALRPYQNYCYAGEDYKSGEKIVEKGSILTAEKIGIIASTGISQVWVKRKIRVGLLTTGSELLMPGDKRGHGQIYNSGFFTLSARLKELGCQVIPFAACGDDVLKTCQSIDEKISEVDILLTTGGVSVGQKDIMHPVIDKLGAKRLFWKLKMKPGSPALVSLYKGKPIISLSGNPMALGVTFELLFNPYQAHLMTCDALNYRKTKASLVGNYNKKSPVRRFIKAFYDGKNVYLSQRAIGSGNLLSSQEANCLIDIPKGSQGLEEGDQVSIIEYRRT